MPAGRLLLPAAAIAVAGLGASGCGSSAAGARDEPAGRFPVQVVDASFPGEQQVAEPTELRMTVRNAGRETMPNLAVTLDSLDYVSSQPGLADARRPLWIVDAAPLGANTAYTSTWALPDVPAGQTRTLTWKVTAVRPGRHVVRWRIAAGLDGRARAVTTSGAVPQGRFDVQVSDAPPDVRIDPETGETSGL